jgi:hypothetical protein
VKARLLPVVLALALPAPAAAWTCVVPVKLSGFEGTLAREIDGVGRPKPDLTMEVARREPSGEVREVKWYLTEKAAGPRRPYEPVWVTPRPEQAAFREGPSYVSILWNLKQATKGPIESFYYGDGRLVGSERLVRLRETDRIYRRQSLARPAALIDRPLLARLAEARQWTAVAVDGARVELYRATFNLPTATEAEAEYRRAKAELRRMERNYWQVCTQDPSPDAEI